jgi:hypothetical protein
MSALPPKADIRIGSDCARRSGFGNLALVAIRRALAGCTPGAAQNSKAAGSWIETDGFAFLPANADFREALLGLSNWHGREIPTLRPPMRRRRGRRLQSDQPKHRLRAIGLKRHFCDAGTDRIIAAGSAPRERNWGYQREAQCGY